MKEILYRIKWLWEQCSQLKLLIILSTTLGAVLSGTSVIKAIIGKNLIDNASKGNIPNTIKFLCFLGALLILDIIVNSIISYISTYCSTTLSNKIQKRLFEHIIYGDWLEISKYHTGNFLTRLTDDVGVVTSLLVSTIPGIISSVVLLLSSFITLCYYAPTLAVISLIVAPIMIILSKLFGRKLRKLHIEMQETESNFRSFIQESLHNNMIIKTFCLEDNNINTLTRIQSHKLKLNLSRSFISIVSNTAFFIGSLINYFLVFLWGAFNLSKGNGAFGTMTALIQLSGNVQGPMSKLASSFPQIIAAFASAERLMVIESIKLEKALYKSNSLAALPIQSPSIKFNDIEFGYKENSSILKNISFNICYGEIVGLVGPSGEGKTTLIRLLLSLINEHKGSKCIISNSESFSISPETRSIISYVPQGNTLFSGTIRENLLFGNLEASDEELGSALKSAFAWDFVDKLPEKLYTKIGEKGLGLSEGQAQRLAIARAFLRKTPILILDEATSSLDTDTEIKILRSISTLEHKPTTIIITHRLSALSICNRILKLENGCLHEIESYSKEESAAEIN